MGCDVTDPDILEFNHIRDKLYDLSFMVARGYSITRMEMECRKVLFFMRIIIVSGKFF